MHIACIRSNGPPRGPGGCLSRPASPASVATPAPEGLPRACFLELGRALLLRSGCAIVFLCSSSRRRTSATWWLRATPGTTDRCQRTRASRCGCRLPRRSSSLCCPRASRRRLRPGGQRGRVADGGGPCGSCGDAVIARASVVLAAVLRWMMRVGRRRRLLASSRRRQLHPRR